MPLILSRNDITKTDAEVIVLPANERLQQGRGTSCAIYTAAGEEQLENICEVIGSCQAGDAVMTDAFDLPAKAIIHAVGPVWRGGSAGEPELLYQVYQRSLQLAFDAGYTSIAFPLLSAGNYGYPKAGALEVANRSISDFLMAHDMDVQLVFYDQESLAAGRSIFREIREYIDDHYAGSHDESYDMPSMAALEDFAASLEEESAPAEMMYSEYSLGASDLEATLELPAKDVQAIREQSEDPWRGAAPVGSVPATQGHPSPQADSLRMTEAFARPAAAAPQATVPARPAEKSAKGSLKDRIRTLLKGENETFHEMLFRLIDESGMSYPQVYTRANMSKKLFSKIKLNSDSIPKKKNILALAISLRLDMEQTEELLMKAGYVLSNSSMADVIISYFIEKRIYDVFEINEALFEYGLENELLGF